MSEQSLMLYYISLGLILLYIAWQMDKLRNAINRVEKKQIETKKKIEDLVGDD